jgi:hypothetical protein
VACRSDRRESGVGRPLIHSGGQHCRGHDLASRARQRILDETSGPPKCAHHGRSVVATVSWRPAVWTLALPDLVVRSASGGFGRTIGARRSELMLCAGDILVCNHLASQKLGPCARRSRPWWVLALSAACATAATAFRPMTVSMIGLCQRAQRQDCGAVCGTYSRSPVTS